MEPHEAAEYRVWKARQAARDKRHIEERDAKEYKSRKVHQVARNERYREEREVAKYKSPKGTQITRYTKKTRSDEYDSWRAHEEEREERYMKERKADTYDLWRAKEVEKEARYKEEKPDRVSKRTDENQMLGPQNKRVNTYMTQEEHRRKGAQSLERSDEKETENHMLTWEQREQIRFHNLQRKKDFVCLERIDDRTVNILEGLELHTGVFSTKEQMCIVDFVYELQNNYAAKNGNLPGILQNVVADPLPRLFKVMIKRMVRWHILPSSCVPDSCIVNIYDPEDCIPPHIDSHDFVRPFCTVSFLSECDIVFGSEIKIAAPGEFIGSFVVSLPVGSVLVINGNGADVAKHCVPAQCAPKEFQLLSGRWMKGSYR